MQEAIVKRNSAANFVLVRVAVRTVISAGVTNRRFESRPATSLLPNSSSHAELILRRKLAGARGSQFPADIRGRQRDQCADSLRTSRTGACKRDYNSDKRRPV